MLLAHQSSAVLSFGNQARRPMNDDPPNKSLQLPDKEPVLLTRKIKHPGDPKKYRTVTIRRDVLIEEGKNGGVQYVAKNMPLDLYLKRCQITVKQHRAGEKLHALWRRGYHAPFAQHNYSERNGGEARTEFLPPGFLATEYREAINAIDGDLERSIAFNVCCIGYPASQAAIYASVRTAERNGIAYLRSALEDLIEHFKRLRNRNPKDAKQ